MGAKTLKPVSQRHDMEDVNKIPIRISLSKVSQGVYLKKGFGAVYL